MSFREVIRQRCGAKSAGRPAMAVFAAVCVLGGIVDAPRALAAGVPDGVWIDHTGRGGIEFTKCGRGICGTIVWVRGKEDQHGCGQKLIGDVKSMGRNVWDGGWIISPESRTKYDVELTLLSRTKLQVMGYAGSKFLSKTMTWQRAPDTIRRCDGKSSADEQIAARADDKPQVVAAVSPALTNAPLPGRRPEVEAARERARIAAIAPVMDVPAPLPAEQPVGPRLSLEDDAPTAIDRVLAASQVGVDDVIVPPKPRLARRPLTRRLYGPTRSASLNTGTCTVTAPFVTVSYPCTRAK